MKTLAALLLFGLAIVSFLLVGSGTQSEAQEEGGASIARQDGDGSEPDLATVETAPVTRVALGHTPKTTDSRTALLDRTDYQLPDNATILDQEVANCMITRGYLNSAEFYLMMLGKDLPAQEVAGIQSQIDKINKSLDAPVHALDAALRDATKLKDGDGFYRVLLPDEKGPQEGEALGGFTTLRHDGATNEMRLFVIWPGEFADVDAGADALHLAYLEAYDQLRSVLGG